MAISLLVPRIKIATLAVNKAQNEATKKNARQ